MEFQIKMALLVMILIFLFHSRFFLSHFHLLFRVHSDLLTFFKNINNFLFLISQFLMWKRKLFFFKCVKEKSEDVKND